MPQGGKMPQGGWPDEAMADLASRRDALRQAAGLPGADPQALLDAALTELDGAIDALAGSVAGSAAGPDEAGPDGLPDAVRAERRLLHAAFQQTPVSLFLLEQDGTIRRANAAAAALLGAPSGYATGKVLTAFVDLPLRAAVQTLLAAVARTGTPRTADCRILTSDGPLDVTMAAAAIDLPGDPPLLVVAVTSGSAPRAGKAKSAGPAQAPPASQTPRASQAPPADRAIASMTQRLDMVTAVTRLLLDNSTFSEAVTVQRCARLLAGEIADWVIIDVERGGQLQRQYATGPRNGQADQLARAVRSVDPHGSRELLGLPVPRAGRVLAP